MNGPILIVGQGLAGTVLGWELLLHQEEVYFVDDARPHPSSFLAAGLWNPLSFKRITVHELVQEYIQCLEHLYPKIQDELEEQFYFPKTLARIFPSEDYRTMWEEKELQSHLAPYMVLPEGPLPSAWSNPVGYGVVAHAGWLNLQRMIEGSRAKWAKENRMDTETFDPEKLVMKDHGLEYKQRPFGLIIFCTGRFNPGWKPLDPIKIIPNKGHVITLHIPGLDENTAVHYGNFLVPIGQDRYKLGSTYQWDDTSTHVDTPLVEEMLDKLKQHIQLPFEVEKVEVGHRPTVMDRNGIVGLVPGFPKAAVMNGLGTKGVLTAPYLASLLRKHLTQNQDLPKAVNINRFFKRLAD